jgi:hypothetical protein
MGKTDPALEAGAWLAVASAIRFSLGSWFRNGVVRHDEAARKLFARRTSRRDALPGPPHRMELDIHSRSISIA